MNTDLDLPTLAADLPTTTHRVRWGEHEALLRHWQKRPPQHPENPRYRAFEFRVEGRLSLFESIVNLFRERGWMDPPPPDYKWAIVTAVYRADEESMDGLVFA